MVEPQRSPLDLDEIARVYGGELFAAGEGTRGWAIAALIAELRATRAERRGVRLRVSTAAGVVLDMGPDALLAAVQNAAMYSGGWVEVLNLVDSLYPVRVEALVVDWPMSEEPC